MHLVKFSINGQRADVAKSTANVTQSTTDVAQSVGVGRGPGHEQRVGFGADVVLT